MAPAKKSSIIEDDAAGVKKTFEVELAAKVTEPDCAEEPERGILLWVSL